MQRQSFRTKILRVVVFCITVAMFSILAASQVIQSRMEQKRVLEDLSSISEVLTNRSAASLEFYDRKTATENLASARFKTNIDRVCLYNSSGVLFAQYTKQGYRGQGCGDFIFPQNVAKTALINNFGIEIITPIDGDGVQWGFLTLKGNFSSLKENLLYTLPLFLLVAVSSALLCFYLASRMLKNTLRPLTDLGKMAQTIIEEPFSQQRAHIQEDDEIGDLVKVFNKMLDNLVRENAALIESELKFRSLSESSPVGIYFKNAKHEIVYANRRWMELCGVENQNNFNEFYDHIAESDRFHYSKAMNEVFLKGELRVVEYVYSPPKGPEKVFMEYIAPIKLINKFSDAKKVPLANFYEGDNIATLSGYVGSLLDITELKATQKELEDLAYLDPLTRLPNRRFFNDHLRFRLAAAKKEQRQFSVLMIDLDNFKRVNDTMGHDAGDRLLTLVAERLRHEVFDEDVVSRMGGDEFVLLLESTNAVETIDKIAEKILRAISKPVTLLHHRIEITCSIGVARYPRDAKDSGNLFRNADIALYEAKSQGKNCVAYFSPQLSNVVEEKVRLESKLTRAISNNELSINIQPQYDANSKQYTWGEVLLRWNDSESGVITPGKIIPIAEESGLIYRLGHWIFHETCRVLAEYGSELEAMGIQGLSVNLSAKQFYSKKFLEQVRRSMKDFDIDPGQIEFELTESVVMEDIGAAVNTMSILRKMGFRLSIDDFGTGYSSLSYLKHFPIDAVKIDKSFVAELPHNKDDVAITAAILALADRLGLSVVAEGVETQEQYEFLLANGCGLMQGYLFCHPKSIVELVGATRVGEVGETNAGVTEEWPQKKRLDVQ